MPRPSDLAAIIEQGDTEHWVSRAACGDLPLDRLDMFFVDAGRSLSKEAAALCRTCPVRTECLDHAETRDIAGGYFGGVSPSKRRADRRHDQAATD